MKTLSIIVMLLTLLGCQSQKMIGKTTIPDTEENRSIIQFTHKYNKYINNKDVENLYQMAAREYYDNGGTAATDDDFGYGELKKRLQDRFALISEINQKIEIKQIVVDEDKYFVSYRYNGRFQIKVDGQKRWHTKQDMNQLVLVKTGDGFKVIKGM